MHMFFYQKYSRTTVLAVALAVSYHHSVYERTGNLFFISHAVTGVQCINMQLYQT